MRKKFFNTVKLILALTPLMIGIIGYLPLYDGNIMWAVYASINLYQFNTALSEINILVEIARWTAPMGTLTILATLIVSFKDYIFVFFKTRRHDTITLHGNSDSVMTLKKNLDGKGIHCVNKTAYSSMKHVIAFGSDEENLAYYREHYAKLEGKRTYLELNNLIRDNIENEDVIVFNNAENCARLYWRSHPIYQHEKVVIIGFDSYGENILSHGLVQNTFSVSEGVEYHIFGDADIYLSLHTQLHKMCSINQVEGSRDRLFTYDLPWYKCLELIKDADRIIICEDDSIAIRILAVLISKVTFNEVHIRLNDVHMVNSLFGSLDETSQRNYRRIIPFGSNDELYTPEYILNEQLMDRAKSIHYKYFIKYNKDEEVIEKHKNITLDERFTSESFKKDWSRIGSFLRYSNVSQADHMTVKLKLLGLETVNNETITNKLESLSKAEIDLLSEIEHIRWEKYYYINNWIYDANRVDEIKQHNCLKPYSELSQSEKDKDFDAYKMLAEILSGMT